MIADEDIAAWLPKPPLPAPARRDATISEALRRFDGGGPPAASGARSAAPPAPWRTWLGRPQVGILASAALVVLIALPVAWISIGDQAAVEEDAGRVVTAKKETGSAAAPKPADPGQVRPATSPPPTLADSDAVAGPLPVLAESDAATPADARKATERGSAVAPAPTVLAQAPPAAAAPAAWGLMGKNELGRDSREDRLAGSAAESSREIVISARKREESYQDEPVAVTANPPSAPAERVDEAAKSKASRAAPRLADSLSLAGKEDVAGAIKALDRAIEIAPRSSLAYLNRGLAYRRYGKLDRAIADLDQAVRYAPREARLYYIRSVMLRQQGDRRRASADEKRAIALDPGYADVVRSGR
jgi:hypothetical protein